MKLKLDENLGLRGAELLRKAGHQVASVAEQGLCGAEDGALIEACRQEARCLVTLDLDFGNPLLFKPSAYHGIAVLRLPARASHDDLLQEMRTLCAALEREEIVGKLWVIQRGRVRVYQENVSENT